MADKSSGAVDLHPAWQSLGSRAAVASGALCALVSLAQHVPVWMASLRGLLCFLVVGVAVKWGLAALSRAVRADADAEDAAQEKTESS